MTFSLENRVGRLVEGRIGSVMSDEDTVGFRTRMWAVLGGIAGRAVLVGDLTEAGNFSTDVEARLTAMLRHDNPKVERSALVWGKNQGAFAAQAIAMIDAANRTAAEAGRPVDRRGFTHKHEAVRWLEEVLAEDERARLAHFIEDL